ncbi:hypothetical protein CSE899_09222 [Cronobacter sakazakii E899]|nr:hypothetical protein CSE899_09222 [Cronobacter sakazakii E899]
MADETPVVQLLQALAESEQLNLVVAPGVEGVVSLHLQDVPLAAGVPDGDGECAVALA